MTRSIFNLLFETMLPGLRTITKELSSWNISACSLMKRYQRKSFHSSYNAKIIVSFRVNIWANLPLSNIQTSFLQTGYVAIHVYDFTAWPAKSWSTRANWIHRRGKVVVVRFISLTLWIHRAPEQDRNGSEPSLQALHSFSPDWKSIDTTTSVCRKKECTIKAWFGLCGAGGCSVGAKVSVHLSMPSFLPYFGDKKATDWNNYGWLAKSV